MLRRIALSLTLFIIAIFLIAFENQKMLTVRLTEADSGATVRLHPGDLLEISLPGNPTTGYTWELKSRPWTVLKQKGEAEYKPDSNILGSAGRTTFRFDAVADGTAPIVIIYHRAFEPGTPPLQTFSITVLVKH